MAQSESDRAVRLVRPGGSVDRFTRWIAFIGVALLLLIALVIVADIVLRYVFDRPIEGLEDISRFTFAIAVATCFPAGLLQGHNVTIRFLGKALGSKPSAWLEVFGSACTLVFFVFLAWRFGVFAVDEARHHRYTQTLELPTAPFWSVITLIVAIAVPVQVAVSAGWFQRCKTGAEPDAGTQGEG